MLTYGDSNPIMAHVIKLNSFFREKVNREAKFSIALYLNFLYIALIYLLFLPYGPLPGPLQSPGPSPQVRLYTPDDGPGPDTQ